MAFDGSLLFGTEIDTSGVEKGLDGLEKTASGYSIGKNIFSNLATDAIKAAAGALQSAAQTGIEFEASMSKVAATSGATSSQMEELTALSREYGESTVFSSSECADALNYMAMAGWNVQQMTNGLPGILNLAAASGEDLATTSDIVTDALTAFGMSADDSAHFADVLAIASSKSNTNVSMMGETFKYVAPVAGALGYNCEDVAVAVGLMANSGIKASQAGTSLRAILSNLTSPTKAQAEAMEALGISMTDSDGNMKSLESLLRDLRTSFSGLSETQAAQYASTIGGQEAMSGLLAIVNASDTDFNNLKNSIYNCDGACDDMASTMTDNVSGQMKTLSSMAEELQLSLYDMFEPMLKKSIPKLQKAVAWVTDNLDEIIAGAKPVGIAFAAIFAVNKVYGFTKALRALNSVVKANPVGAVLTGIEAVIALIGIASALQEAHTESVKKAAENYSKMSDEAQKAVDEVDSISESWENVNDNQSESYKEIGIQYDSYDDLLGRLDQCVDKNGEIKSGYEGIAQVIVSQLNDGLGTNLTIQDGMIENNGKAITSFKELQAEIDKTIQKQRLQATLEAAQEGYTEAQSTKKETTEKLVDTEDEYKRQMQMLSSLQAAKDRYIAENKNASRTWISAAEGEEGTGGYSYTKEYRDAIELFDAKTKAVKDNISELSPTLAEYKKIVGESSAEIENYDNAYKDLLLGNYNSDSFDKLTSSFRSHSNATVEELKTQQKEYEATLESMKAHTDNYSESEIASMESLVSSAAAETRAKMSESVSSIASAISNGFPTVQSAIQTFGDGIRAGFNVNDISTAIGSDFASGFKDGVSNNSIAMEEASKAAINSALKSSYTGDLATEALAAGFGYTQNIVEGAKQNSSAFEEATKYIILKGYTAADATAIAEGTKPGYDFGAGIAEGIYNSESLVVSAANYIGSAAIGAYRNTTQTHSPSRIMVENGGYFDEGLAKGVYDNAGMVKDAGNYLGSAVISGYDTVSMRNAMVAPANPVLQSMYTGSNQAIKPATEQSVSAAPSFTIYCQIGEEQIDAHIVNAIASENANSGGWTV